MKRFIKLEKENNYNTRFVYINPDAIQMVEFAHSPKDKINIWLNDGRAALTFPSTGNNNANVALLVCGREIDYDKAVQKDS